MSWCSIVIMQNYEGLWKTGAVVVTLHAVIRNLTIRYIMNNGQNIKPSVEKHLIEQRQLLQMEYEHERDEYKRISEQWGVERTVRRGLCWFPLRVGRNYYNSLNQLIVDVYRPESHADDEHQFEYGRQVRFFTADDAMRVAYKPYTGVVSMRLMV